LSALALSTLPCCRGRPAPARSIELVTILVGRFEISRFRCWVHCSTLDLDHLHSLPHPQISSGSHQLTNPRPDSRSLGDQRDYVSRHRRSLFHRWHNARVVFWRDRRDFPALLKATGLCIAIDLLGAAEDEGCLGQCLRVASSSVSVPSFGPKYLELAICLTAPSTAPADMKVTLWCKSARSC
jgi:hypothetical protein